MVDSVERVDVDEVEVLVVVVSKVDSILMTQVIVKVVGHQEEELAIVVVETEVELAEVLREENYQKLV